MDAVTYPQESVKAFISSRVVPVRVSHDAQPYASDYQIKWTPSLVLTGPDGDEHHRTVGFLPPEELVASLLLGSAKWHFDAGRFREALRDLDELVDRHPRSDFAPEAIYYQGVSRYKDTEDAKNLKAAYERLAAEYPNSEWTKRAYPYRLL